VIAGNGNVSEAIGPEHNAQVQIGEFPMEGSSGLSPGKEDSLKLADLGCDLYG